MWVYRKSPIRVDLNSFSKLRTEVQYTFSKVQKSSARLMNLTVNSSCNHSLIQEEGHHQHHRSTSASARV